MIDVRSNLRAMISQRGDLQKKIALETGRGESAISNWLNGKGQPSLRKTLEICEVLEISIVDVFTYPEKYVPESQANPTCEECVKKQKTIDNLTELLDVYKAKLKKK